MGKRHSVAIVNCTGWPSHVLFPRVRSGLSSSTGLLLSTESSAYFSSWRTNVDVNDSTVWSEWAHPFVSVANVLGEKAAAQALPHIIVDFNSLFKSRALNHEHDWAEILFLKELSSFLGSNDSWFYEISLFLYSFSSV